LVTGGTSCPEVETALAQTQTRRRRQRRQRHLREDETESTFATITFAVLDCVRWTLGPAMEGITDAVSAAIHQIRQRFPLPVSSWKFWAVHGMGYFLLLFAAQRFQILKIRITSTTVRPADNDNTGKGLVWDCGVWGTGIAGILLWLLCYLLAEFEHS
jgi:Mg2+ and Co2+ transporter CorA